MRVLAASLLLSLGTVPAKAGPPEYVGCYGDIGTNSKFDWKKNMWDTEEGLRWVKCNAICLAENYGLFSLTEAHSEEYPHGNCWCGTDESKLIGMSGEPMPLLNTADTDPCMAEICGVANQGLPCAGSDETITAVYRTDPDASAPEWVPPRLPDVKIIYKNGEKEIEYLGCNLGYGIGKWHANLWDAQVAAAGTTRLEMCNDICFNEGKIAFGLVADGPDHGNCYCGDSFIPHMFEDDTRCLTPGKCDVYNGNMPCGGSYSNGITAATGYGAIYLTYDPNIATAGTVAPNDPSTEVFSDLSSLSIDLLLGSDTTNEENAATSADSETSTDADSGATEAPSDAGSSTTVATTDVDTATNSDSASTAGDSATTIATATTVAVTATGSTEAASTTVESTGNGRRLAADPTRLPLRYLGCFADPAGATMALQGNWGLSFLYPLETIQDPVGQCAWDCKQMHDKDNFALTNYGANHVRCDCTKSYGPKGTKRTDPELCDRECSTNKKCGGPMSDMDTIGAWSVFTTTQGALTLEAATDTTTDATDAVSTQAGSGDFDGLVDGEGDSTAAESTTDAPGKVVTAAANDKGGEPQAETGDTTTEGDMEGGNTTGGDVEGDVTGGATEESNAGESKSEVPTAGEDGEAANEKKTKALGLRLEVDFKTVTEDATLFAAVKKAAADAVAKALGVDASKVTVVDWYEGSLILVFGVEGMESDEAYTAGVGKLQAALQDSGSAVNNLTVNGKKYTVDKTFSEATVKSDDNGNDDGAGEDKSGAMAQRAAAVAAVCVLMSVVG